MSEFTGSLPLQPAEAPYHPQNAVGAAINSTLAAGGAGLLMASVQNSLAKSNVGAMGVFSRSGSTVAIFAAMGGVFEFSKAASANLREKDDVYNTSIGAFLGGAVLGLGRYRALPGVLGMGFMASVVLSAFDYTGGRMQGYGKDPKVDEFARKEELRKNKRRPVQETIAELGEGRGIYAAGYEERRRERLAAAGIQIPDKSQFEVR